MKAQYGNELDKLGYDDFEQTQLDHTTSGHTKGGTRVHSNPNKPKTVFNDETEIPQLAIETIKNGTISPNDEYALEHDFKRPIGEAASGKTLTKVRLIRFLDPATKNFKFVTTYPIE